MNEITERDIERFFSRVQKSESCWNWSGGNSGRGYGKFRYRGKNGMAHRFAYEAFVGIIPDKYDIDHICHNRSCVNPLHLRPVTRKQNLQNLSGAHRDSKSGVRGVDLLPWGKWRGQVMHDGVHYYLGCFDSLEAATAATLAKRLELFTHNDVDRQNVE